MKTLFLILLFVTIISVGCKKTNYDCHQKITATITDSIGYLQIQYSEFQLNGSTNCIIGTVYKDSILSNGKTKHIIYTTTCN